MAIAQNLYLPVFGYELINRFQVSNIGLRIKC
jgi:hypothetical protein